MEFVGDRLGDHTSADDTADIYRAALKITDSSGVIDEGSYAPPINADHAPVEHVEAQILALGGDSREVVMDALRVRAMDFVSDRIGHDYWADDAADIYRAVARITDDDTPVFDPDVYRAQMALGRAADRIAVPELDVADTLTPARDDAQRAAHIAHLIALCDEIAGASPVSSHLQQQLLRGQTICWLDGVDDVALMQYASITRTDLRAIVASTISGEQREETLNDVWRQP
jgi:hypothetical protein